MEGEYEEVSPESAKMWAGRKKSKESGELPGVGEAGVKEETNRMRREKKGEQKTGRELGRDRQ